ncbi:hypothetical protein EG359_17915 [Chryseobacterium joostei]|uniref:Branched-chain amino acid:cation transporter, LIVCS family n=1 Tax=Chryseobacterium joostei TaxID=112234 RepID=A0A1N7K5Y1_9FLAO|nr:MULTISPECIES: hypothetical protein [Chryseobacterium]AZB01375.1 hypothetical protein EG359_17915 [Chryseobacterium joostei]SIS56947.1 hypothetical protein SAMN05421768_11046 [Chryseobacterium joostei]HCM32628.1 hypothetical protein [Chryseobacterium sp.]
MENIKFSSAGKYTFLISFVLGTLLFLTFLIVRNEFLLLIGFAYVGIAIMVNTIILLYELGIYLNDVSGEKSAGNSALLLLLNIPIASIYLLILFNF